MGEDAAVLVGGLMFHSNTGHQTKKKKKKILPGMKITLLLQMEYENKNMMEEVTEWWGKKKSEVKILWFQRRDATVTQ